MQNKSLERGERYTGGKTYMAREKLPDGTKAKDKRKSSLGKESI